MEERERERERERGNKFYLLHYNHNVCFTFQFSCCKQLEKFTRLVVFYRSYLVLTSGQKPKKSLEPFLRKVSDFELIWRLFREYRQIKNFFQNSNMLLFYLYSPLTLGKKIKKSLKPFLRKLRY